MTEKCKYSKFCKYYRSENYTCADKDEAFTYCGAYGLFSQVEFEKRKKFRAADRTS